MKRWIDYYETLQVHPKAGREVIKAAYRKLTALNHPDVCREPASEERMKRINLAYEVLMDEKRRRIFHEDWLEHTNVKEPGKSALRTRESKPASAEDLRAFSCLNLYFNCLERKKFEEAYQYITETEKGFIRARDFIEWQEAVAKVIEISTVRIQEFKKHRDYESRPGVRHFSAYEFEVSLSEKNRVTGKIGRNSFSKMVVKDGGVYGVLVGYDNLRPLVNKFNVLAEIKENKDAISRFQELETKYDQESGLLNKKGLLEEAGREEARFKRYGRMFSIVFVDCIHEEGELEKQELLSFLIGRIRRSIRSLDIFARWDKQGFVLLLPETGREEAEAVAEKLEGLFGDEEICVGNHVTRLRIQTGTAEYNGHSLMETIYKARVRKNTREETNQSVQDAI